MMKKLAVFDFDHTIIDANSDTVVRDLIPLTRIPALLGQLHKKDGWTAYMQAVFQLLDKCNIGKKEVTEAIERIKPVAGMCELISFITTELNYDVIIISDSNTYFIHTWLEKFNLCSHIKKVYSNPAHFVNDTLKIDMYHLQTECQLSTKNLCKGRILEEYISAQKSNAVYYNFIMYIGDGGNDICPILRLNECDLACIRYDYKCADLIKSLELGKPIDNTGKIYKIKSDILLWKTGYDILSCIQNKYIE